ncbi:porin [Pandoraea sp.]|uniref:porin n=1 Tax=Pandoraea sp. TaxID=1883445 RepID=UPI0025E2E6A5|nr:porin [Pandoraea sp.]
MRISLPGSAVGAALLAMALAGTASAETFSDINTPGSSFTSLYGVLDVNVETVTHADAAGDRLTREKSGGLSNDRFGFKGREDLGGGLAAFFALEAGFDLNDGTQTSQGTLFNRTAEVGLASRWGALSAGLQYTAMYDILLHYDPMSFSPQYTWLPSSGSSDSMAFKARVNNSVKYVGHAGGLTVIGDYSFGNDPASFQSSAAYGAGLEYRYRGFGVGLAYDYRNGAINAAGLHAKTSNWSASARQAIGPAVLMGGYEHYLSEPVKGASATAGLWFGGVRYAVSPRVKLTAAAYYQQAGQSGVSNALMGVLSGQYHLSRRTDLYATLAYAGATHNGDGSYTAVGVTKSTAFMAVQTAATLGIRHRF